ncbi:MAG: glycosyltransferase, partial [Deltaproteobacteria bacterium]|nr:glycosyltransferase [Deltaproteobacteria bacterium]
RQAEMRGLKTARYNLETTDIPIMSGHGEADTVALKRWAIPSGGVAVGTELLEHMSERAMLSILERAGLFYEAAIWAVPNDCLGPGVEPQHQRQFTALSFLTLLRKHWKHCRVECIEPTEEWTGRYLIGVCGKLAEKAFRLSVAFPVKNEASDLERVLCTFRGVADEIILGIDSESTDETEKIARKYAEDVFPFTWENSFAKARNVCIERASGDWILTSEGHMHLESGHEFLLNLQEIPGGVGVLEPTIETRQNAWRLPYLFRNSPEHRFYRDVHNALEYGKADAWPVPQIVLWHERDVQNAKERFSQRRYMNRKRLMEALLKNPKDGRNLFYLASEWSANGDRKRSIQCYERFLAQSRRGSPFSYQSRLALANHYMMENDPKKAYDTLIVASRDDWSRTEHWLKLGDICFMMAEKQRDDLGVGMYERAMRFFQCAAQGLGQQPASFLWIDKDVYTYLPAQRLVSVYCALGLKEDALAWAEEVADLMPEWVSDAVLDEARANLAQIKEWINGQGQECVEQDSGAPEQVSSAQCDESAPGDLCERPH